MPSLLSLLRLTAVTLCFGSLAACTTTNGSALVDSQVSVEISGQAARAIADGIHAAVRGLEIPVGEGAGTVTLTVSIGIATCGNDKEASSCSESNLLRRADKALYCAKLAGRNQSRMDEPPGVETAR